MKTPKLDVWPICQRYLTDHQSDLGDLYGPIHGWYRSRAYAQLASCSTLLDPTKHGRACYQAIYQVESFFKKNSAFTDGEKARCTAVGNFASAETKCRVTNRRLEWYYLNPDRLDRETGQYLSVMQSRISEILGDYSAFVEELPTLLRWTGGATATTSRVLSDRTRKIRKSLSAPAASIPLVDSLVNYFTNGRHGGEVRRLDTNRIQFVPKSWKTDRTIACEPNGTLPLQLAFDSWTRPRLRKRGQDLGDQERNASLAKEGSLDGSFATIDLSQASDTLAYNAVALLLPTEWYQYLSKVRSPYGHSEDTGYVKYAKFSSMGNGATFVLETLIFYAACLAVGSQRCEVYGDDIVIETALAPKVIKLLKYLGFATNSDKTFTEGPFRESCGKFWYEGADITPFYVRSDAGIKTHVSLVVNGMMGRVPCYGDTWRYMVTLIRDYRLLLVPYNDDPTSGVFIDMHSAYGLGLLRVDTEKLRWVPSFRAYVRKDQSRRASQLGGLFLWMHQTDYTPNTTFGWWNADSGPLPFAELPCGRLVFPWDSDTDVSAGERSTGIFRFKTVWRRWNIPPTSTPAYMYNVAASVADAE